MQRLSRIEILDYYEYVRTVSEKHFFIGNLKLTLGAVSLVFVALAIISVFFNPIEPRSLPPDEVADWGNTENVLGVTTAQSCPGISYLDVLLDKNVSIPTDYAPPDLVIVNSRQVPSFGNQFLRAEAANQLAGMLIDAKKSGLAFAVYSGFRPSTQQATLYREWSKVLGVNSNIRAAPPGHSEHQLGTAADLVLANGKDIYPSKTWDWLFQNAYKYGFVMSYGENQEKTGYQFEPWHWRFVGLRLATQIRNSSGIPQTFYRKISCS